MGLLDGAISLAANINKTKDPEKTLEQGVVSPLLPELELEMSDEELSSLQKKWLARYEDYYKTVSEKQTTNEEYWLGNQHDGEIIKEKRPLVDNLIFQALETFLPIATARKPEPVTTSDNTTEGELLADRVNKMLKHLSDVLKLKLKLKQSVRFWSLYYLGVVKVGWDVTTNDITLKAIRPQKLILDPNATVEECDYTGEYIGEYKKETASNLVERFPAKAKYISNMVNEKMGTEIQFIEWWTNKYTFWTVKDEVLGKTKNPHWNYDETKKVVNEYGVEIDDEVRGSNHFENPQMPYVFLSVFNLGLHPHDDTTLIEQNLALQDLINKRMRQIDKNADATNGSIAVSGESFTKEQASQVDRAARKGSTFYVPTGNVNNAIARISAPPLPNFVAESLGDYRNQLMNVFGVTGVTAQGIASEETVRGKILVRGQDAERIGGGVTEYVEQFADNIFNWFVQLMYVYYTEEHSASVIGAERAREWITIKNSDLNRKLLVSVKEGSTIPKDPLTQRNEAIDLWGANAIDPITLYEKLDFPNPKEAAEKLVQWQTNPQGILGGAAPGLVPPGPQSAESALLSEVPLQ